MARCLYCGAELRSETSHFCPGHHRIYRRMQIQAWENAAEGSDERAQAARKLRRFPGWWDYESNRPAPVRGRSGSSVRTATAPVVERHFDPIEYNFRKFGIELETVSRDQRTLDNAVAMVKAMGLNIQDTEYTHSHTPYWKVLTDASLSGGFCREVVSPAFTSLNNGFNQVQTLASVFTTMGVKVNNSCGFHCHLDVADLTPKQFARIVKFYQVYEQDIDKLHQASRRGNAHYTGTLASYNFDPDRITTMSQLTSIFSTRYLKVNVQAYVRHRTVEFRQHGATVDPVKIINWVKFCTRIVEYAKSERPIDHSIDLFTALNLSDAEKLYWNHRKEVLAA